MNLLKKAVAILASAGMCLTVMTSVFAAGTVSGSDAGVSPSEPSSVVGMWIRPLQLYVLVHPL